MDPFHHFYRKSIDERLNLLHQLHFLEDEQFELLKEEKGLSRETANHLIENVLGTYELPYAVAPHFLINGEEYVIPMAIEEPSVVAAASNAARMAKQGGGFHSKVLSRSMVGQIAFEGMKRPDLFASWVKEHKDWLFEKGNNGHPSLKRRGGGIQDVRVETTPLPKLNSQGFYSSSANPSTYSFTNLIVVVDTQDAMGANMINDILEALKAALSPILKEELKEDVDPLMSVLSNYAIYSEVQVQTSIPSSAFSKKGFDGKTVAKKIAQASALAQVDPYRAMTHNKGILNGIDAFSVAIDNDWRGINAAVFSGAVKEGQLRGLSTWLYDEEKDKLNGFASFYLPMASVGGSISIHPMAQLSLALLGRPNAKKLMEITASVGLAQNLAALRALVSEGIQQGHMALQANSLALAVGATEEELDQFVPLLNAKSIRNQKEAKQLLEDFRQDRLH